MTIEELQASREAILKQMAAPSSVTRGDMSVQHRQQSDLEAALRRVDAEIAALQSPQPRNFVIQANRGLS